jgi:hypothetical protein
VARRSTQWAYNLPVPGGTITQTLAAVCPGVDITPAALGLASFAVRAPAGAPGAVSWQYRLLCAGTDVATDNPGMDPAEAAFRCATLGDPATRAWTPGPLLDPGTTTVVAFPSYGLANWTLQVATRDPAAPGIVAPCGTTRLVAAQGDAVVPFAAPSIVFAPVLSNDRALAAVSDLAAATDTLSKESRARLLELTMKQDLLLRATNLASLFGDIVRDIQQQAGELDADTATAIQTWTNATAAAVARDSNESALLIAAYNSRAAAYADIIASMNASAAAVSSALAQRRQEFDAIGLQLNATFAALNETRVEAEALQVEAAAAIADMNRTIDGLTNFGEDLLNAVNTAANAIKDVAEAGFDLLKSPLSFFGNLLANLVPLLILVALVAGGFWVGKKLMTRRTGAYAPVDSKVVPRVA